MEKEKRFSDLTEEQKIQLFVMWKRKRPKIQINGVVKVLKGTKEHKQTYYRLQKIERNT